MSTNIPELREFKYYRINVTTGTRALSVYYSRSAAEFANRMEEWNAMLPNQWKYEVAYGV